MTTDYLISIDTKEVQKEILVKYVTLKEAEALLHLLFDMHCKEVNDEVSLYEYKLISKSTHFSSYQRTFVKSLENSVECEN